FTCCAHAVGAFAEVFNDCSGATLNGELTCNPKNHVLCGGPAAHFAGELNTDELRHLQFPGKTSHHVNGVSATNTDSDHGEATRVGGMGVRSDHHTTGECIVFKHHLMNDSCAGFPETYAVFVRD